MDIKKILTVLGASLPVVVVGGIVALNRVADPPEYLLDMLRIYELPEEERRKVYKAYSLCHNLASVIERHAVGLYSMAYAIAEQRGVVIDETTVVLERFEEGFKTAIRWAAADLGVPSNKLEKVFSYKAYGGLIDMARAIKSKIERGEPPYRIYDSAKFYLDEVMRDVRDAFVECLATLNVLKVPLHT